MTIPWSKKWGVLYIAYKFLKGISRDYPNLFEHWKFGFLP